VRDGRTQHRLRRWGYLFDGCYGGPSKYTLVCAHRRGAFLKVHIDDVVGDLMNTLSKPVSVLIEQPERKGGGKRPGPRRVESAQGNLFSPPDLVKQDNDAIVTAFRDRLKDVAGFKYVPDPLPMKNSNNAVVYYLFLASQKAVAEKIIRDIFAKYR
jgi:hypothetical protein